jgi:hypothetical protein
MSNPKSTLKKLLSVFVIAILGAVISLLLMLTFALCYSIWGHGTGETSVGAYFLGISLLLASPAVNLESATGIHINPVLLNCLIGAVLFALVAAFWQFLIKGDYEQ